MKVLQSVLMYPEVKNFSKILQYRLKVLSILCFSATTETALRRHVFTQSKNEIILEVID